MPRGLWCTNWKDSFPRTRSQKKCKRPFQSPRRRRIWSIDFKRSLCYSWRVIILGTLKGACENRHPCGIRKEFKPWLRDLAPSSSEKQRFPGPQAQDISSVLNPNLIPHPSVAAIAARRIAVYLRLGPNQSSPISSSSSHRVVDHLDPAV